MRQLTSYFVIAVFASQAYSAPQFISVNDGKLGVNFGGYHAAVGLGGLLGGGAGGGLFAEAGTPYGQAAKAGLGGAVDGNGGSAGGLYAGATAGGNVRASTGLAGGVTAEKSAGGGYASAQAGNHHAAAGLGGEASGTGASGFTFSGTKTLGVNSGPVDSTLTVQPIQPEHKKVHKEFEVDAGNELNFVPLVGKDVTVKNEVQPQVVVKEVYVPSPPRVVEKHIVHTKPRHHFHKTAYIGGYIGGAGDLPIPPQQPIQRRVDVVDVDTVANSGSAATANADIQKNIGQTYTKQVTFQRNPNFFADIFNIPISTLRAVGNFLGNTAGSTSVSVQKSGTVQAETDSITPKHAATSSVSSSDAHISVQTPNVSKVIDDIFAIPINTLGAVNKFLENNVPARKAVQVSADGTSEPAKVRFGPLARRRANKQVIIVQQDETQKADAEQLS